ncbi:MAG: putative PEP-binding protein, partial [Gemmatimonadales bacterium]
YTLAVDRGNATLASRFTPLHPAILRLIRRIVEVGAEHGLEVSVCGEMASQPLMAFALIGLGVRQLSVAARSVPLVKRIVRGVSASVATDAAEAALATQTAREAGAALRSRLMSAFGNAPFLQDGLPAYVDGNTFEGYGGP